MPARYTVLVCRGPDCGGRLDSAAVLTALELAVAEGEPLAAPVELGTYSCFGRCRRGPNVLVREILPHENPVMVRLMPTSGKNATLYHGVQPVDARRIIEEHVRNGVRLADLVTRNEPTVARVDKA